MMMTTMTMTTMTMPLTMTMTKTMTKTMAMAMTMTVFYTAISLHVSGRSPNSLTTRDETVFIFSSVFFHYLVGGVPTPLKKSRVNWDDDIPNISGKIIQSCSVRHHQPVIFSSKPQTEMRTSCRGW